MREWVLLSLAPTMLLAAVAMEGGEPSLVSAAAATRQPTPGATGSAMPGLADLDVSKLQRPARRPDTADAFESKSWFVQPAPVPAARLAPAPPQGAPPLPFTYLGRYQGSGEPVIFLVRGERILTVSAGEIVEGLYRVEGISGSTLGLTYLPLNVRQSIDVGAAG
jgi:hypothetical protein